MPESSRIEFRILESVKNIVIQETLNSSNDTWTFSLVHFSSSDVLVLLYNKAMRAFMI